MLGLQGNASMLYSGQPFDLRAYVEKLSPDLGYAILTAAIVEEELERLLLAHEHYGLIDDETRNDLLVIKDIRNAFAHTRERLDFKATQIKAIAERFGGYTKDIDVKMLFEKRVSQAVTAIQASTDRIVFEEATAGT